MADLDPYLLRAFLTIAEVGTVNGAAGSLHRTQAAVSMQIRKLEGLVGVTLFDRSTKGLGLTAEGQVLIRYAREIITLNDEIVRRLNGKVIEGRVRFGVVEDFVATRLIDILRVLRDQNPRVEAQLREPDVLPSPVRKSARPLNGVDVAGQPGCVDVAPSSMP